MHETDNDRIVVTEQCGYCRTELSRRISTNEIERIRRDILNLTKKVEAGQSYLIDVLNARKNRYNTLVANLNRDENN